MPLSLHSEVSHVSSCLGQQCILVPTGAPLLSDVPPKLAGTYVCPPPQDPEDMPRCPGPHPAQFSPQEKPELKRGTAFCEPADYTLDTGVKKPVFSTQICPGFGLSTFRVLINIVLHCTAYSKGILHPYDNPPAYPIQEH